MTPDRSFSLTTSLLEHQAAAVDKLLPIRVGALLMEQGTGKSRTAIELVHRRLAKLDRVVWFCPVSLRETVRDQILTHTSCTDSDLYLFDDSTSERNMPMDRLWYVVGIESMSSSPRAIFSAARLITDRTYAICDESSYIKGHKAARTEHITDMAAPARYRMILNGTPITQGVVDLYAQMRFLDPRILGYRSFYSFAANHLEYHPDHPGLIVRAHNVDVLTAKMRPYVYQVTKDCLGLPDKLHESYACSLTADQRRAYNRAKEDLLATVRPDDWDALYIFRLFTALQSIISGCWTRPDGTTEELANNRVDLLLSVLERIPDPERVIIWCRHLYSVRSIREALSEVFGPGAVAEFTGENAARRNSELDRWRRGARFLLATMGAGGHGLTLTESRYAIFYENGFKYSERVQAEDRQHRIGQVQRPVYIDLSAGTGIEERIFRALGRKANALHEFRHELETVKKRCGGAMADLLQTV